MESPKCYVCKQDAVDPVFCKDGRIIPEENFEDEDGNSVFVSCHCATCIQPGHRHCDECDDCVPEKYVHLPCGHCDSLRVGREECTRCSSIDDVDVPDMDDGDSEWLPTCSIDAK